MLSRGFILHLIPCFQGCCLAGGRKQICTRALHTIALYTIALYIGALYAIALLKGLYCNSSVFPDFTCKDLLFRKSAHFVSTDLILIKILRQNVVSHSIGN